MSHRIVNRWQAAALSVVALMASSGAWANCTDKAQPLASPVDGVRLKFYPEEAGARENNVSLVRIDSGKALVGLTVDAVEKGGQFSRDGGSAVFEEPDGQGGWRICREELWQSRKYFIYPSIRETLVSPTESVPTPVLYQGTPLQERNPILAKLTRHYFLYKVKAYSYGAQGRLVEEREYQSDEINNNPVDRKKYTIVPEKLTHCLRYHEDRPQMVAWHGHRLVDSAVRECSQLTRANAEWEEYGILPDGRSWRMRSKPKVEIKPTDSAEERAKKELDGEWYAYGSLYAADSAPPRKGWIQFNVNERHGLYFIRDRNDNSFAPEDRTPLFTDEVFQTDSLDIQYQMVLEPVPIEVALNGLDDIYDYRRIRVTQGSRLASYIAEEFPAGSHHPVRRMWSNMNGIFREEFFDEAGRPVRTINRGYFGQDMGYEEDLRAYAEAGVLKVTPAEIFQFGYRVYEYDAQGNERLVLVCWEYDKEEGKPYRPFPWWTGEKPKQFANRMEQINYYRYKVNKRCSAPDGSNVVEDREIEDYMRETYDFGMMKFDYYSQPRVD